MKRRLPGGLLLALAVAACAGDEAKKEAIRGKWACQGAGVAVDTFSFERDGSYEHIRERGLTYDAPPTYAEWKGSWSIEHGALTLEGESVFAAQEVETGRWRPHDPGSERLTVKIKTVGKGGLELEPNPKLPLCVFSRTNALPEHPTIAALPSAAPIPKPAVKDCGCAPSDLTCQMKCSASKP
jgi:hypothetical protein